MRFVAERDRYFGVPVVELTRHNLTVLLAKLDDPRSARMIVDPDHMIAVRAVEDVEHYTDRPAGPMFMPSSQEWI
jgi:hypothetical protein